MIRSEHYQQRYEPIIPIKTTLFVYYLFCFLLYHFPWFGSSTCFRVFLSLSLSPEKEILKFAHIIRFISLWKLRTRTKLKLYFIDYVVCDVAKWTLSFYNNINSNESTRWLGGLLMRRTVEHKYQPTQYGNINKGKSKETCTTQYMYIFLNINDFVNMFVRCR